MCQVHKLLKKYKVTFQIIKNTLKIALCYVPSTQNIEKIPCFNYIFMTNIYKILKKYKNIGKLLVFFFFKENTFKNILVLVKI